jgi:hypothetical protein
MIDLIIISDTGTRRKISKCGVIEQRGSFILIQLEIDCHNGALPINCETAEKK